MFLKNLTLKGFKSFAEPTTLEFEPGITVLVGPNGSGKSNVVDAVAWVLGAQGPRSVRSGKMEDVIFAGSSKRPALGRAEVSLAIDNSAGRLPIDLSEITITRTLFRSGDSDYALNGAPCRLLDIQELLSDSGVGRQQHVIVSQGRLDGVLSAQAEERRLIIEEAAGVLKFRRRRERAERRLEATESNLVRLQDLLREVRRQLRPLERQADAARRHDGLEQELRSIRMYMAGRELTDLASRRCATEQARSELNGQESVVRAGLSRLDAEIMALEDDVSRERDLDPAPALGRVESLKERARGLAAVLSERRRSAQRDLRACMDEDLVASLEGEGSALRTQLSELETEISGLAPRVADVAKAEQDLVRRQGELEGTWAEGSSADKQVAEAMSQMTALGRGVERDRAELARLGSQLGSAKQRRARCETKAGELGQQLRSSEKSAFKRRASCDALVRARSDAESEVDLQGETLARVCREHDTWAARAQALSEGLEDTRADHLEGLAGVLGRLADLVEVDPGWRKAFEAAAGEALGAVVVRGPEDARLALECLRSAGRSGSILHEGIPGLHDMTDVMHQVRDLDSAGRARALRPHVRSDSPAVVSLLDRMLQTSVMVPSGWAGAIEVHLRYPYLVVLTADGDRFSSAGWRTGGTAGKTVDEARSMAGEASRFEARAKEALASAKGRLSAARAEEEEAVRELDRGESRWATAASQLEQVRLELGETEADVNLLASQWEQLSARITHEEVQLAGWQEALPGLESESSLAAERAAAARSAQRMLREQASQVASMRKELDVRAAGLEERRSVLAGRLGEVEQRLAGADRDEAARRLAWLEVVARATARLGTRVQERLSELEEAAAVLGDRRRHHVEAIRDRASRLDEQRHGRSELEHELSSVRERIQRAEIAEAEVRLRQESSFESVRRDLDADPEHVVDAPRPEVPEGMSLGQRARELERELRLMGPINPLALEELASLSERHELLERQLEDVRAARRDLGKVIRAVDGEIVDVFAAAYTDVADNFSRLCSALFPGGSGQLRLTDPTNLLETGLEIEARPPGRNVRRLALLSGGERSLVVLAFLFAVFRSRPSPFYLLDEVEAALDDVNLHRFLELLHDFREEAQLIVVSHQKRTMEAADCLFGVTMQDGGSTRVVTERMRQPA